MFEIRDDHTETQKKGVWLIRIAWTLDSMDLRAADAILAGGDDRRLRRKLRRQFGEIPPADLRPYFRALARLCQEEC